MKQFRPIFPILLLTAALTLAGCSRDLGAFASGAAAAPHSSSEASSSPEEDAPEQSSEEERLLSESAAALLRSGTYYLDCVSIIQMEELRLENTVTIAVDGGNSSVKTTSEMSGAMTTVRVLTLDGVAWLVNDIAKTCVKVDPAEMSGGFDADFSGLSFEERGEGPFDGETLRFEQYDQQGDTIRFFFGADDRLCGLTRSIDDEQLAEMTLRIRAISGNIPAKTLALPEGFLITK